ncbi:rRNA adenine N(6)-methyltransferase family protein [Amycolatopsis aidingensis]|uniref:rRNA adenine N(6)-methyltransferase family protein n=1 Tax=Amycolatopsis aidingensis TaxID=2842453 RepID=UPI001E5E3ABE|nr:rRNA adenine N(6)-methyltransferase family protein [Amycolatopsis aidingensis]
MPSSGLSSSFPTAPNPSGVHFLAAREVVHSLLESCPVGPADLVLDLGAGPGAITAPLVRTGAKVIAVERDPAFARKLSNRLDGHHNLRVVTDDLRTVPLPRKEFAVVASIPYAVSSALLRRLLHPCPTPLRRAALIVEWGFAKRLARTVPRNREQAWWAARFELELVRRVPARCFRPVPSVDSAVLAIRGRNLGLRAETALWTLLGAAYRDPRGPARTAVAAALAGRKIRGPLQACGISPNEPAGTVPARRWAALARRLAADPALHWPRLPRELRAADRTAPGRRRRGRS